MSAGQYEQLTELSEDPAESAFYLSNDFLPFLASTVMPQHRDAASSSSSSSSSFSSSSSSRRARLSSRPASSSIHSQQSEGDSIEDQVSSAFSMLKIGDAVDSDSEDCDSSIDGVPVVLREIARDELMRMVAASPYRIVSRAETSSGLPSDARPRMVGAFLGHALGDYLGHAIFDERTGQTGQIASVSGVAPTRRDASAPPHENTGDAISARKADEPETAPRANDVIVSAMCRYAKAYSARNSSASPSGRAGRIGEEWDDDEDARGRSPQNLHFFRELELDDAADRALSHLVLRCDFAYKARMASPDHERNPSLHFYLSKDCGRKPVIVECAGDGAKCEGATLRFPLRVRRLLSDCMLNLSAYTCIPNEQGRFCVNQAGFASVPLGDALRDKRCRFDLLEAKSADPAKSSKGSVELTISEAWIERAAPAGVCAHGEQSKDAEQSKGGEIEAAVEKLPVRFSKGLAEDAAQVIEAKAAAEKLVQRYVSQNRAFYSQHKPSNESVRNVTVYYYQGRCGYAPGCLFDLTSISDTRESYVLHCLSICAARRYNDRRAPFAGVKDVRQPSEIDLEGGHWMGLRDEAGKCALLMEALCLFVNYCKYITDELDHNDAESRLRWSQKRVELVESFDPETAMRDAGDCEDTTEQVLQTCMDIKHGMTQPQSRVMVEARRLLDQFVFVSSLCGVTSMALNMEKQSYEHRKIKLNAHECAFALPKYTFYTALRRRLTEHAAEDRFGTRASVAALLDEAERCGDTDKGRQHGIYILEGTGKLLPEPSEESEPEQRLKEALLKRSGDAYRASASEAPANPRDPIAASYSTYHYRPGSPHNFYKMMMTLITPELFLRFGVPLFEFLLCYDCTEPASAASSSSSSAAAAGASAYREMDADSVFDMLVGVDDSRRSSSSGSSASGAEPSYTRGVWFVDLMNIDSNRNVHILPCPALSSDVLSASSMILRDEYPPLPLVEPEQAQIERFMAGSIPCVLSINPMQLQTQAGPRSRLPRGTAHTRYVHFRAVKSAPQFAEQLKVLAKQLGVRVHVSAEPVKKSVLDDGIVGGYAVTFYVP